MDRRKFIINSAFLTGGMTLGINHLKSASFLPQDPVRIGVIGTGSRGTGLSRLIRGIDGMEVTACSDVIPFRLKDGLSVASEKAKAYENYRELLADKDIDAVIISTPFSMHGEMALNALVAGKHVYCEKTMTRGLEETQAVLTKAKNTDRIFQTGHQYHSSSLYNKVLSIIQSGYIGEVTAFECQWNRNNNWRRTVPDPKWEKMINWRMYREYSGGLVAELMSHQIDFINWVLESHPEKITGFGGIDHWKDGRETFDNAHLLFQYPSGVDASFTCTTTNGFGDYQIKVLGKKGTIILDYNDAVIYSEGNVERELGLVDGVSGATLNAWQKGKGAPIEASGEDPTIEALKEFRDSIFKGTKPLSGVETGALTSKCVHISLEALHKGGVKYWKDYPELV